MKQADKATMDKKNNGKQPFTEKQSERVLISDQGKINALKHVLTPPDYKSQMEVSNWNPLEVENNAIIMTQRDFLKDPTIDCVESHLFWKSVFRRGVDGQLTEETIQLNRSQFDPTKMLGSMGGDIVSEGMNF